MSSNGARLDPNGKTYSMSVANEESVECGKQTWFEVRTDCELLNETCTIQIHCRKRWSVWAIVLGVILGITVVVVVLIVVWFYWCKKHGNTNTQLEQTNQEEVGLRRTNMEEAC